VRLSLPKTTSDPLRRTSRPFRYIGIVLTNDSLL
jgi:hypothetical protein